MQALDMVGVGANDCLSLTQIIQIVILTTTKRLSPFFALQVLFCLHTQIITKPKPCSYSVIDYQL